MGEDPGNGGPVAEEQKSPEELRREIEQTREELGDTAAALGAKADVKARAHDRVDEIKHSIADKTPSSVGGATTQATATARSHPVPLGVLAGFAIGFAVGRLLTLRSR